MRLSLNHEWLAPNFSLELDDYKNDPNIAAKVRALAYAYDDYNVFDVLLNKNTPKDIADWVKNHQAWREAAKVPAGTIPESAAMAITYLAPDTIADSILFPLQLAIPRIKPPYDAASIAAAGQPVDLVVIDAQNPALATTPHKAGFGIAGLLLVGLLIYAYYQHQKNGR